MNIFLHEINANKKSTIIWAISISLIFVMFMSIFPSFKEGADEFQKMLSGYDPAFLKAFGVPEDLFSLVSFYSYLFTYVTLCGAVQAMNLGLSVISKEARNKTADFLLSKPVSRAKIVTAKIAAVVTLLLITNLICFIIVFFLIGTLNESFSIEKLLMVSSILPFIQFIFFGLGFLIAVCAKKIKNVLSVSMGIVFGLFALGIIQATSESEVLRCLIPFKYIMPQYIIENGIYETKFLILGIGIFIISIITSYIIYLKKDIHAV